MPKNKSLIKKIDLSFVEKLPPVNSRFNSRPQNKPNSRDFIQSMRGLMQHSFLCTQLYLSYSITLDIISMGLELKPLRKFLSAPTHPYKRACPYVRRFLRRSVLYASPKHARHIRWPTGLVYFLAIARKNNRVKRRLEVVLEGVKFWECKKRRKPRIEVQPRSDRRPFQSTLGCYDTTP